MKNQKSLTQVVAGDLRERIFSGVAHPGARLNIAELAKELKVSALPVREALRNLETEGLVEFFPNKGATVKALTTAEVEEIFLLRSFLEETTATAAALNWRHARQLDGLETILKKMDDATKEVVWHRLHSRFHQEIYELSGYPKFIRLASLLRSQMRIYTRLYMTTPEQKLEAQAEHYVILDCLRQRDIERLKCVVGTHLERPARMVREALLEREEDLAWP